MLITTQLKKAKTAFITGALALATVVAPVKAQAAETTPKTNATATIPSQKVDDSVLAFLPVTKDGYFDEAKSKEIVKAFDVEKNMPYIKAYFSSVEKGLPVAEAYEALITKVAGDNQELRKLLKNQAKALEEANNKVQEKNISPKVYAGSLLFLLAITVGSMVLSYVEWGAIRLISRDKQAEPVLMPTVGAAAMTVGAFIGIFGGIATLYDIATREADAPYMEKQITAAHRQFYNAYAESLKAEEYKTRGTDAVQEARTENAVRIKAQMDKQH